MSKTVVVVDDFPNTRKVVLFSLNKLESLVILEADNGKEALKFFDGRAIDLLITDLNMPVMDGLELAKTVRSMDSYSYIPILMLTTETDQQKKDSAKASSVTGWIQKPFKAEQFVAVVEKCLK
jgi:two-component system, chemotaxis family, chemotaxis protein CheY